MTSKEFDRFVAKIQILEGSCWIWQGSTVQAKKAAYGQFSIGGKLQMAHRVIYEHFNAPIPEGMTIDHLCRNTLCVNHRHLRVLSLRDNILCGTGPSAMNVKKTHCPKGHPYAGENVKRYKNDRKCRLCNIQYDRDYKKRKREAQHG